MLLTVIQLFGLITRLKPMSPLPLNGYGTFLKNVYTTGVMHEELSGSVVAPYLILTSTMASVSECCITDPKHLFIVLQRKFIPHWQLISLIFFLA